MMTVQVTKRTGPHWPTKPGWSDTEYVCLCGYRAEAFPMLSHVETWNNTTRTGPVWKKISGLSMCINIQVVPGHALTRFQNMLRPYQFRVKCSCGFESKYRSTKGVKEARLHVEEACCTILGLDAEAVRKERRGGI
jgi:hypothetical protein